jgi:hypothetical protein
MFGTSIYAWKRFHAGASNELAYIDCRYVQFRSILHRFDDCAIVLATSSIKNFELCQLSLTGYLGDVGFQKVAYISYFKMYIKNET